MMLYDEEDINKRAAISYDRANYPQGKARQLVATITNGNRKPRLASVTAPTLVIHGAEDPLGLKLSRPSQPTPEKRQVSGVSDEIKFLHGSFAI